MKHIARFSLTAFIGLLFLSGCSIWPKRTDEPKIERVYETKLWCPTQSKFPRPEPIDAEAPNFLVLRAGETSDIGLVCMSAEGYESLGSFTNEVVRYGVDSIEAIKAYEDQVDRSNSRNQKEEE